MDLELKNLGQTLALGGVALTILTGVARSWGIRIRPLQLFPIARMDKYELVSGAVLLAFIFAAGIIAEDYSRDITSRRSRSVFAPLLSRFIRSDSEARFGALVVLPGMRSDKKSGGEKFMESRALASEVLHTLEKQTNNLSNDINRSLKLLRSVVSQEVTAHDFEIIRALRSGTIESKHAKNYSAYRTHISLVDPLYYYCKNRAFQNPQYFRELQDIQDRLKFVLAASVMSIIASIMLIITGLARMAVRLLNRTRTLVQFAIAALIGASIRVCYGALISWNQYSSLANFMESDRMIVAAIYSIVLWTCWNWRFSIIDCFASFTHRLGELGVRLKLLKDPDWYDIAPSKVATKWPMERVSPPSIRAVLVAALGACVLAIACDIAHESENMSFNQRVFGYAILVSGSGN